MSTTSSISGCPLLSCGSLRYPCRDRMKIDTFLGLEQISYGPMSKEQHMVDRQLDLLQQHLIVEKGLARNTLAAYMSDLQHFCAFAQARDASTFRDLTREDILAYLAARRQQGIAARTLARELVSLKTLYRF